LTYRFDEIQHEKNNKSVAGSSEREENSTKTIPHIVNLQWLNANASAEVVAAEQVPDYYTYHTGNGIDVTTIKASTYKKLLYKNLYPGIDMEYKFHPEKGIEYSLIIHPGADVSQVKMKWTADGKNLRQTNSNIHIPTMFGDIVDHAPITFYAENKTNLIESEFIKNGNIISFKLGNYDRSKTIVIDPWTVNPVMPNSNRVWEVETDANGNSYIYGGDSPILLQKYNVTGGLVWTYNTGWDTTSSSTSGSSIWIGTLKTDPSGNCYATAGSGAIIIKVDMNGNLVWSANGGALDEYWGLTFNCDYTQLIAGGTRLVGLLPITGDGKAFNINLSNGSQISSVTVAKIIVGGGLIPNFANEIRSICSSPNGKFYFHTLDTIGELTSAMGVNWRILITATKANWLGYYCPSFSLTDVQAQNIIRASSSYIYTMDGANLYQRNITNGALIKTVSIPGGSFTAGTVFTPGLSPDNNGIDLDSCGNIYVGSKTQIHKFDPNLNLITSVAAPGVVYDIAVTNNGNVLACGPGYVTLVNMSACPQVHAICVTSTLSINVTNTNPSCNGQCTGTGTATPTSGTSPYKYNWNNGQTTQIATGLCAGTYSVTVTDASSSTASSTITVTAPTAMSPTPSSTAVTCNGMSNGTAGVVVTGGTPGYTYSWSNGKTTSSISNLSGGTYTVTITDTKGCTTTSAAVVNEPPALVLNFPRVYYICGEAGGTVQLTASGGTSYTWSSSPDLSDTTVANPLATPFLPTTTYTVTVANGPCSDTAHVTINIVPTPNPPTVNSVGDSLWVVQNYVHYQWYFEGSPLAGDSNFYVIALLTGHYSVYVTDSFGCKVITQSIYITVGIPEYMQDHGIKIFPNPAGNWFEIQGLKFDSYTIEISDALGQQVYHEQFTGNEKVIHGNWSPGVYFVQIENARELFIEKIIIQ
jgi:hypothetical protein